MLWFEPHLPEIRTSRANQRYGAISQAQNCVAGGKSLREQADRPSSASSSPVRHCNAFKSAMRSKVEHVFAHQKGLMGLVVRTIGLARARVKIGLVNLAYNIRRFVWLSRRDVPA